jgi:histidine triad (HIT) family protein
MCIFCKIVNKELPSNIVEEDDNFLAFHDINPHAPVHILVIPKVHTESFHTADAETLAGLSTFTKSVAEKMGIDKSGYRVITNIGEDGGQEVPHLHLHLLGGGKLRFGHFTDADAANKF